MDIIAAIKNDARGALLINDWIGDGGEPVSQDVAEVRVLSCVSGDDGKPCPFNKEPNWWNRIKSKIADTIKRQLEIKNKLRLELSVEEQVNMCQVCGCCIRLKAWTPIEHIKKHTSDAKVKEFPAYCWVRHGLES